MKKFKHQHSNLISWYEKYGRHDLPWRNTDEIYHVYLSEIMLQQTQVNRVREEYYFQFLTKFPSLLELAKASLDDVLTAWSGLGYYSRARNLHKTAQLAINGLPESQKELMKLPGIGQYTASAICSFGYNQNISVVDTNIARVIKRFFALLNPTNTTLLKYATDFVNVNKARDHNLALMDLGSLVCLPKNPKCEECPFLKECQGSQSPEIYTQVKKTEYEALELFCGVLIRDNKIALQLSSGSMYQGMLLLPYIDPVEEQFIGKFKHAYTKYRLSVNLYKIEELDGEIVWVDLDKLGQVPISSLTKKAQKFFILI